MVVCDSTVGNKSSGSSGNDAQQLSGKSRAMSAETGALIPPGNGEQASFTSFTVSLAGKYQKQGDGEKQHHLCLLYDFLSTVTTLKKKEYEFLQK